MIRRYYIICFQAIGESLIQKIVTWRVWTSERTLCPTTYNNNLWRRRIDPVFIDGFSLFFTWTPVTDVHTKLCKQHYPDTNTNSNKMLWRTSKKQQRMIPLSMRKKLCYFNSSRGCAKEKKVGKTWIQILPKAWHPRNPTRPTRAICQTMLESTYKWSPTLKTACSSSTITRLAKLCKS